jgi:hypothetical protein
MQSTRRSVVTLLGRNVCPPRLHEPRGVGFGDQGRQEQHRHVGQQWVGLHSGGQLAAVEAGHHEVEQHEVRAVIAGGRKRVERVVLLPHVKVAGPLEAVLHQVG